MRPPIEKFIGNRKQPRRTTAVLIKVRNGESKEGQSVRLTTQLSDGAMTSQHAGAPTLVCALGSAARGRALYAKRRSLQRRVRRQWFIASTGLLCQQGEQCGGDVQHDHACYLIFVRKIRMTTTSAINQCHMVRGPIYSSLGSSPARRGAPVSAESISAPSMQGSSLSFACEIKRS